MTQFLLEQVRNSRQNWDLQTDKTRQDRIQQTSTDTDRQNNQSLKQGALIHKKDRNGDPPLVCAVLANNLEVVRLLVQVRDPSPKCVFDLENIYKSE